MLIRAGGVIVFVKDQGTGTPILFLHGNPDTADVWNGVIGHLQQRVVSLNVVDNLEMAFGPATAASQGVGLASRGRARAFP